MIEKITSLTNLMISHSRIELPEVSFDVLVSQFMFEFGHKGEMIELELATDISMIDPEMSLDEIDKQVKWLYMDAKTKYTNWVFNDG